MPNLTNKVKTILFLALLVSSAGAHAADFFVAPTGSADGDGSSTRPWDLQTALAHPDRVQKGDTIFLRGGTYSLGGCRKFISEILGEPGAPITVRGYPGERSIVDGGIDQVDGLGGYVNFQDLEISCSLTGSPQRLLAEGDGGFKIRRPYTKLINLVIHDALRSGIYAQSNATNYEVYGVLSYYNGVDIIDDKPRGHGHGIYGQSESSNYPRIEESVFFSNFGSGIQMWGTNGLVENFHVEGNVCFNASAASALDKELTNLVIGRQYGGVGPATIKNNFVYLTGERFDNDSNDVDLGFVNPIAGLTLTGNYFATNTRFNSSNVIQALTGNTFIGIVGGINLSNYSGNVRINAGEAHGTKIEVRPNRYQKGRANIIVFNWDGLSSVSIDLGSVLPLNTAYEIRDVQDYFGPPVTSGIYSGGGVSLGLDRQRISIPVDTSANPNLAHTGRTFNTFVLLPKENVINTPPSISSISDQTMDKNTSSPAIAFGVTDSETSASNLTLSKQSSNEVLLPLAGITFGGSAENRTVTLIPAANQTGTSTVTIAVSDGQHTTSRSFTVTVREPPARQAFSFEAENGVLSAPMTVLNSANASGGAYAVSNTANSGATSFAFNVPAAAAGSYMVWARILAPGVASDSFFVSVDGAAEDIFDVAENRASPDWQWSRVNGRAGSGTPLTLDPRVFDLGAGAHQITFRAREPSTGLDQIIITNDLAFVPSSAPAVPEGLRVDVQ